MNENEFHMFRAQKDADRKTPAPVMPPVNAEPDFVFSDFQSSTRVNLPNTLHRNVPNTSFSAGAPPRYEESGQQTSIDPTYADFLTYFSGPKREEENRKEQKAPEAASFPLVHRAENTNTPYIPVQPIQQNPRMQTQVPVQPLMHVPMNTEPLPPVLYTTALPPQPPVVPTLNTQEVRMPAPEPLTQPILTQAETTDTASPVEELPILEELGIDPNIIAYKALAVMNPLSAIDGEHHALSDADLAGPLVVILFIAFMQTIVGKLHYGFLYGLCTLGTLGVHGLLSLIPRKQSPQNHAVLFTASILGYCLMPIGFLSVMNVLCTIIHTKFSDILLRWILTPVAVIWASFCSAKMFASEGQLSSARGVVMYPLILLYAMVSYAIVY